jgi:transcriptional regulator with XRE-family HTH domain
MQAFEQRTTLRHFLRSRRARVQPTDVGLPGSGRRRGSGLRREEVAAVAGISVTWYTWLEQGRPIQVSPDVLDSLARTLCLSPDETRYLHQLAGTALPLPLDPPVSAALQGVLDALDLSPAFVMGRTWDILAWNAAASYVFGDFAILPPATRNVVWLVCTGQSLCRFVRDPEMHARRVLAEFRSSVAPYLSDERVQRLLAELHAQSALFRTYWEVHDVRDRAVGQKTLIHPDAGELTFAYTTLQALDTPGLRLVIYSPDPPTHQLLRQQLGTRLMVEQHSAAG